MNRVIRLQCFQSLANYRKPTSHIIKETYPLPPYSTVLGMIHAACGYKEWHSMKLSIQGINKGTISDLYTRYSFTPGGKYEEGRHQICVEDDAKYGIFKGIANTELVCDNRMIIHILPAEEDFQTVYESLKAPKCYLALGRHEDILSIESVDVVNLQWEESADTTMDIYIPVDMVEGNDTEDEGIVLGNHTTTIYNLTREYEITSQGLRRWKKEGGRIRAFYFPKGQTIGNVYVDDYQGDIGSSVVVLI